VFSVVLDTCVLYSAGQRDFFLSLAIEGLFRPLWSAAILDELHYCEVEKFVDDHGYTQTQAVQRATDLIAQMTRAFDDALITGWERLEGSYGLPDPDDEHLVAAAEIGGAAAIISDNIRDLPSALVPSHIQVIPPATFALTTVEVNPLVAARAIQQMALRTGTHGPAKTPEDLLNRLESTHGFGQAVSLIRPFLITS